MGVLTKKYRLFWITETKEILNDYTKNHLDSITMYKDGGVNTYFESDDYQDILDKINTERLIKLVIPNVPPTPPE